MKVYSLKRKQVLPINIRTAWQFFSNPFNLARITPTKMRFEIVSLDKEQKLHEGQIIDYKINIVPILRTRWQTEITKVHEPVSFTDEQKSGPYSLWVHHHHFHEVDEGVEMTDEVFYSVPFGWLGRVANFMFVDREVNAIFDYRYTVLQRLFKTKEFSEKRD